MNTSILKKCLDELSKPTPRLDYVIGMLETLIETQSSGTPFIGSPQLYNPNLTGGINLIPDMGKNFPIISDGIDEDKHLVNAYERGPVASK